MNNAKELSQFTQDMQGKVSDSTLRVYGHALRQFFSKIDGSALTPALAQSYIDALTKSGKSPSTVGLRAYAIMSFFRWKKMEVHLDCPPIAVKKPEYLKRPEINKAISACRAQLEKTIIYMLYDTAIRISELLNLTIDNIDWDYKIITVIRKGGRETEVNVSDKALRELKAWLDIRQSSSSRVFLDLDYYTAWGIVKNIGKRAGLKLHPHIFRHSRAIQLLRDGVPINVVSQHLGHKSIRTTIDIYGQFMTLDLKEQLAPW